MEMAGRLAGWLSPTICISLGKKRSSLCAGEVQLGKSGQEKRVSWAYGPETTGRRCLQRQTTDDERRREPVYVLLGGLGFYIVSSG